MALVSQNNNMAFLEASFGRSIHGSGDTPGYHYGFAYGQEFSRKLFWQIGFEGTLNDSPDFLLTYQDPQGKVHDASLHTVTAGFQIVPGIKYNFVQSDYHQFGISVLSVFRYQATSLSDFYITLYPALTNLPVPVRDITRIEPGRTFAVGGSLRVNYQYNFGKDFFVGVMGAFQIDTNGDTLPHYSLRFGKIFH